MPKHEARQLNVADSPATFNCSRSSSDAGCHAIGDDEGMNY